jgi:hypothetical protein
MAIPAASLTGTEVGFFSVVATVIPVFLLAYLIQLGKAVDVLRPRVAAGWRKYLQTAEVLMGLRRTDRAGMRTILAGAFGITTATAFALLIQIVLCVAVVAPASAEYLALHALYADKASAGVRQWCLVGTATAGAIVILPLVAQGLLATSGVGPIWEFAKTVSRAARGQELDPKKADQVYAASVTSGASRPDSDATSTDVMPDAGESQLSATEGAP